MTIELQELQRIAGLTPPVLDENGQALELKVCCRNCGTKLDMGEMEPLSVTVCPVCKEALTVPQYFAGCMITAFCNGALDNYVCKAYDPVLDRDVALKISKAAAETLGGVRLLDNARTLGLVDQPGVMPVLDGGVWNGYAYWTMPWMERGTLADVLKLPFDDRFTLRQTMHLLVRLSKALETAEQRGFGHYDINPRNILVNYEWMGHLTNFRRVDEYIDYTGDPEGLRRFDGWRYFSPDLLTGATPGIDDDVFSFGVTIYELLSGVYPFGMVETPGELLEIQRHPLSGGAIRRHPATDNAIVELVERMISLAPGARPRYREIVTVFENRLEEVL